MTLDVSQNNILEVLQNELIDHESTLKTQLATSRRARSALARLTSDALTFSISILSLWANEGEESLYNHRFTGRLEDALNDAANAFKILAKRSDIQAKWEVKVLLTRKNTPDVYIAVPAKLWQQHTQEISGYNDLKRLS